MLQTELNRELTAKNNELKKKVRRLEADLSYHVKKERELKQLSAQLLKGAISTEYGALIDLVDKVLYRLETGASKEDLRKICLLSLRKYLGTDKTVGILAKEINHFNFGIIDALLKDYPEFGVFEANLFSCMMINVSNSIIMETFDLGTPKKTAMAKHTLITSVRKLGNIRYLNYLKLLEKKDCTLGKNLLSLHDLSKFCHGKPEKNKD